MNPKQLLLPLIACFLTSVVIGCGGAAPLVPVEGTVTLDGDPLVDAKVVFLPEQGRPSSARTDESGRYRIMYTREVRGALIGRHKVQITTSLEADESPDPEFENGRPESIPAKYNTQSTLVAEVSPRTNARVDFELETN